MDSAGFGFYLDLRTVWTRRGDCGGESVYFDPHSYFDGHADIREKKGHWSSSCVRYLWFAQEPKDIHLQTFRSAAFFFELQTAMHENLCIKTLHIKDLCIKNLHIRNPP